MPRSILTDEKVLEKCMESYPLPFALVDEVLQVGKKKEDNGFMPFAVQRRKPNPPERQEYLANAINRARRNVGQANNRNELEKIRSIILRERPNYPEYVRNVKDEGDEELEEKEDMREPDEPITEQLKKDDEDIPEAEAVEVLPSAVVVEKKKKGRPSKKQLEEQRIQKEVDEGRQQQLNLDGSIRGTKTTSQLKKQKSKLEKQIQQAIQGAQQQDLAEINRLEAQLNRVNSELEDKGQL